MLGGNATLAVAATYSLSFLYRDKRDFPMAFWIGTFSVLQPEPLLEIREDSNGDVKIMNGGKTMNKGTVIFFGAIGSVFVIIVLAIGRTFAWW
jgi:hypothetical protein